MFASAMGIFLSPSAHGRAEQSPRVDAGPPSTAELIADVFSQVGDEIYANCVFELSDEQIAVQRALIIAYMQQGATGAKARRLAATQIQVPKVSEKCEQVRGLPEARSASLEPNVSEPKKPIIEVDPKPSPPKLTQAVLLKGKKTLAHWDCAPGVDYVTIHLNGFERKLTGGEICNPYEDVVRQVSPAARSFRLGYTIKTGRLLSFPMTRRSMAKQSPGGSPAETSAETTLIQTAWLPEQSVPCRREDPFAADKSHRVNWGPKTKRSVAGIYLKKLWNKDWFSPQHTDAILARRNIAIHVRLKGEMSEACIGLEPNGWAYVSTLIKDMRATGLNVYIDETYPQMAEPPPVIVASSFSLTSLFK